MSNNAEILKIESVFEILKKRGPETNKGDYGLLTAICGSAFYRGAAALAVNAALRSGVGIARLASIEKVVSSVASKINGCIYLPVRENKSGTISVESLPVILAATEKSTAVLVGCGMMNCDDTRKIVVALVEQCKCPMVLDADALNSLADDPSILRKSVTCPSITPHVGEMSRLCGKSISEIKEYPEKTALEFSKNNNCITILKDSTTFVTSPDGKLSVNTEKNAGLAKGGSGDVLAGMVASLLAQGYPAYDAARCAVKLHSAASLRCAERLSEYGMQPDDIVFDLCNIFAEYGY